MAKLPSAVGKYRIDSLIARGGMGAVYKAVHPTLKRYVILKKLTLRGDASLTERFRREARIMMDLRDERIVHVFDHFREGGSYYIAQEFVDGLSVDALLERIPFVPNDVALLIFLEACRALQYAHDRKVVHRDIKPANILLSRKGDVKLTDFGIAASARDEDSGLTQDGTTLGTPSYMAPEQFESTRDVDHRADIYSLGVSLYETVTGEKPFPGSFTAEAIARIQRGKCTPPRKINPKVSRFIARLIGKCMKPKPAKRLQDLSRVIRLVSTHLAKGDPSLARGRLIALVTGQKLQPLPKRRFPAARALLAAATLILLVSGGAAYLLLGRGYLYELFRAETHGALRISTTIARGYKDPGETYLKAKLYSEDSGQSPLPPEEENIGITFRQNRESSNGEHIVLESQRIYLPSGHYRLEVHVEDELFSSSFHLAPRSAQKRRPELRDGRLLEVPLEPPPPLPLTVRFSVFDQVTGEEITEATNCYVKQRSRWIKWDGRVAGTLRSGGRHQFKFGRMGYFPRTYDLATNRDQHTLYMRVFLQPGPGTLKILSDHDGTTLRLNGSRRYVSGDERRELKRLPKSSREPLVLTLSPGTYELRASRSSGPASSLSKAVTLGIDSDTTTEVRLSFDPESKTLALRRP